METFSHAAAGNQIREVIQSIEEFKTNIEANNNLLTLAKYLTTLYQDLAALPMNTGPQAKAKKQPSLIKLSLSHKQTPLSKTRYHQEFC